MSSSTADSTLEVVVNGNNIVGVKKDVATARAFRGHDRQSAKEVFAGGVIGSLHFRKGKASPALIQEAADIPGGRGSPVLCEGAVEPCCLTQRTARLLDVGFIVVGGCRVGD